MVPIRGDLHLWQRFQPYGRCLVWIQSNQRLPQHAQKTKNTMHFVWYLQAVGQKWQQSLMRLGYFFVWYDAVLSQQFGLSVWALDSIISCCAKRRQSTLSLTLIHHSYFSPNLVITNSPCVLWSVSLLTPAKAASSLLTDWFPPYLKLS